MKIIQINASYKPAYIYGGPTMSVSRLSEELVKAGVDSEVFTTTANGDTELEVLAGRKVNVDGVPVTYFRRITKGNSHFSPALLFSLLSEPKRRLKNVEGVSRVVHIHAWWNLVSVGSAVVAIFLSNTVLLSPRGTLSSYSFRNRTSFLKNIFHQIIGKAILKRCHFHVSSEKEKQDIFNLIEPRSITVIPNFVTLGSVSIPKTQSKTRDTHYLKLLFLSRVEEKKGLDILFTALENIHSPYHLTIAGIGDTDYILFLKTLASKLRIQDKITWVGQQNNDKKFQLLETHDLMILPSHDESFANVVIESLSVGTPVLISSKVGLADYVLTNDFGWVCDHFSNDLTEAIKAASNSDYKRQLIREKAPNQIALDFNDQSLLIHYLKLYKDISEHA